MWWFLPYIQSATGVHVFPRPEPPSQLPPHPIPLGHPSLPAPSSLSHALNLDWRSDSHMIIYMFQCHSPFRVDKQQGPTVEHREIYSISRNKP